MNLNEVFDACVAALFCSALTWAFAVIAERLKLTDDGTDAPGRKLQSHAVPLVGGSALFCVLLAWEARGGCMYPPFALPHELEQVRIGYGLAALIGAFLVGLVDDLATKGLRPALKLAGQLVVAALCARAAWNGDLAEALLAGFVALAAMNAFNTFDNADGAATSLGALGLGVVSPVLAAPLLGFLPFNIWIRRRTPSGGSTPLAYLGDAGSHLLGVLVALVPGAWPVLALPLLDLARLSVVRLRRGSRPWIGDRRHLAHRLQARGLGPTAVVLVLLVVAAPSVAAGALAGGSLGILAAGLAGTGLLFLATLRRTPELP